MRLIARKVSTAGWRSGLAVLAAALCMVAGDGAAQVPAPSESDFFEKAQGKWCRQDIHPPSTLEYVIPDSADTMLTGELKSPRLAVETEAEFDSFSVVENQVVVVFAGASTNRRLSDGSIYVIDFSQEFVFDLSLSRFTIRSRQRP